MQSIVYKISLFMLSLLTWVVLPSHAAPSALKVSQCTDTVVAIHEHLESYSDASAELSFSDILRLDNPQWQPVDRGSLTPGFSRAAHWYRFSLDNSTQSTCRFWLDLGSLHMTDVQMFTQQAGEAWQSQKVGMAYPYAQWTSAERNPSLPIIVAAQSRMDIVFRISSAHAFSLAPQLLSPQGLITTRALESVRDGIALGVLGVLVIFSLIVGYLYRLPMLMMLALTVCVYALYALLLAGYGFTLLWPASVQLNRAMIELADTLVSVLGLGYLYVLLQVKGQLRWVSLSIRAVQLGLLLLLALRLLLPTAQGLDEGSLLSYTLLLSTIVVPLLALYVGLTRRLKYTALVYSVMALIIYKSTALLLMRLGINGLTPLEFMSLALAGLPGACLLIYTLINQIGLGWHREKTALADLEQLKRAEQETLEQRVELRTEQLRNTMRNQTLLLARISHDLRSPLQQVIRDARLLQQSLTHNIHAQSIERTAHQQLDLIDELLEFSQGELKQLELLIAPGYFFGFLREIQESGTFLAERNDNRFTSRFADDLPLLINADFRRLRQVIINLLANATKFTQAGQIEFTVNLLAINKPSNCARVQFMVADNGIGMPHSERQAMLQPFARGADSLKYEGAGLGLYIVRQLLASMHSELVITESAQGGVCCQFVVDLQLASEDELDEVFVESYSASSQGQERVVLIVDDVAITQELLYELLSGYNYNPMTCSSAAEALVMLRDNPVDIIITDQVMPVMDGWDLLRSVRKEWPDVPIMLYSARPPLRPVDLPASVDFDACLLKPAATSELLAQINALLNT